MGADDAEGVLMYRNRPAPAWIEKEEVLKLKWGISFASVAAMTAWIAVAVFAADRGLSDPANPAATRSSFTLFESGPVRPLALSPSGDLLFAANTPDNSLEVFRVLPHGLDYRGSVPVGLEPVAVAAPSDDEVWVVNHLSDSVSIVKIGHSDARHKDDNAARERMTTTAWGTWCEHFLWATNRGISSSQAESATARSLRQRTAARTCPTIRS